MKVFLTIVFFSFYNLSLAESGGNSNYFSIEPPIVVNIFSDKSIKFLQVDTQVKVKDSSVIDAIELHKPAIRHAMLMLVSNQNIDEMKTVKGKERLRKEALETIKKVLKDNTGKEGVTELYFTGFIIQ
jgi:flagellar FliL protein